MAGRLTKGERNRLSHLIEECFHERMDLAALEFGVSLQSVKNWAEDAHGPQPAATQRILAFFGIARSALSSDASEWGSLEAKVIVTARDKILNRMPSWIYLGGQVQVLEEAISSSAQIVLITKEATNDTEIPEVRQMVQDNILRGLSYMYIIPGNCQKKDELAALVKGYNLRSTAENSDGRAIVGVVDGLEKEWILIDHILVFLKRKFEDFDSMSTALSVDDILDCYEQIGRPGDHGEQKHYWYKSPRRKSFAYMMMLRSWLERVRST